MAGIFAILLVIWNEFVINSVDHAHDGLWGVFIILLLGMIMGAIYDVASRKEEGLITTVTLSTVAGIIYGYMQF